MSYVEEDTCHSTSIGDEEGKVHHVWRRIYVIAHQLGIRRERSSTSDANEVILICIVAHRGYIKRGSALAHRGGQARKPLGQDRRDTLHVHA